MLNSFNGQGGNTKIRLQLLHLVKGRLPMQVAALGPDQISECCMKIDVPSVLWENSTLNVQTSVPRTSSSANSRSSVGAS